MLEDSLKLSVEPHLHIMEYMQPMAIDWTCLELTEREEARESCTGSVFMRLEHLRTVESVCHWEIIPMDIREIIPKGWLDGCLLTDGTVHQNTGSTFSLLHLPGLQPVLKHGAGTLRSLSHLPT